MSLILKLSGLGEDHYSVIYRDPDGRELSVGSIFLSPSHGSEPLPPWKWTVNFFQRPGRTTPHEARQETREKAMTAFRACWDSADVPINWPPSLQR